SATPNTDQEARGGSAIWNIILKISLSMRTRIMGARKPAGWLPLRTWERLDNSPNQVGIRKLGLISHALSACGKKWRSQRFIPSIGKPRNVAEDSRDLLFRDIAGKRKCIHAACPYRRIRENGIEGKRSFGPAFRQKVVFHDGDHQP